jgi:hypothetical protein
VMFRRRETGRTTDGIVRVSGVGEEESTDGGGGGGHGDGSLAIMLSYTASASNNAARCCKDLAC